MRVMHVAEGFGGGLMEAAIAMADGAAHAGHDVLVAYGQRPETPADVRSLIDPAVEVRPIGWATRTPAAQLRAARAIRRLTRWWRPDVVQLHSSFAGAVGTAAVGAAVPTILCPQGFASEVPEGGAARRRIYRAIERRVCRRVTLVGAVSHSEAQIARDYGAKRVVRIPNGIPELNPERVVTKPGGHGGSPLVMATGRTVPQRQPEACARILAGVRDVADVAWVGGGGGRRGDAGRRALEAAGVPPTGWLSHDELMRRKAAATVYVHWTAWDGLPLSVLEAVALDIAVVASDIAPNREILGEEGVCATEEEAIERIRRLVEDKRFAEATRERQRGRRGEFSAQAMVRGWLAAYEQAVANLIP